MAPTDGTSRTGNSGAILLVARRALGLSQVEWAQLLHKRDGTIWRWENGRCEPSESMRAFIRELLRRPSLRRRVHLDQVAEAQLVAGGFVESLAASKTTYRELRALLLETGLLKPKTTAA
jgi:DNA-binding transcriptional regulator YiaG